MQRPDALTAKGRPRPLLRLDAASRTRRTTRQRFLAAARETFAELGLGATTVRDIVRRTHLGIGTFYNYFPDKESVFRRLFPGRRGHGARPRARRPRARDHARGAGARRLPSLVRGGRREPRDARGHATQHPARCAPCSPSLQLRRGSTSCSPDIRAATERGVLGPVDADYLAAATWGIADRARRGVWSSRTPIRSDRDRGVRNRPGRARHRRPAPARKAGPPDARDEKEGIP